MAALYSELRLPLPLTGDESVEEIVDQFPDTVTWLSQRGVVCIICGEAFWGSLRELSEGKGIVGSDFDTLVADLNRFLTVE